VCEQCEQVGAANAPPIEPQQIEHQSCRQPLVQCDARTAVPRNAGRVQVLADEPCVRLVARPHDADAVQRCAIVHRRDHRANSLASFLVGVGGIDDVEPDTRWKAVLALEQQHLTVVRQRIEQRLLGGPQALRQEDDGAARGTRGGSTGGVQQVGFVVPVALQRSVHVGTQANDLAGPCRAAGAEPMAQRHRHVA